MDVRPSPEQRLLHDSAAQLVDQLRPRTVRQLDDAARATKLDAAVVAAGWRELRTAAGGDGTPVATAVDVAIVAQELGRGLADAAFLGPTLAVELRRLAGAPPAAAAETVALTPDLSAVARVAGGSPPAGALAVDAAGAPDGDGPPGALVLVPSPGGLSLGRVPLEPPVARSDLTRPVARVDASAAVSGVPDQARLVAEEAVTRLIALGLAVTCADLVGVMRGAVELAADHARERRQYGVAIGSFQAVQHLLADALVATEGSRSVALHAAWAADSLPPHDALAAAATAKAYCARAARAVCETAVQVHGGIGNTWECLAHVYLRRALLSADVLGDVGPSLTRVLAHRGLGTGAVPGTGAPDPGRAASGPDRPPAAPAAGPDFGDSPEEAAFRRRLRDWLRDNNPGLPPSSTSDEYWAGQAAWHRALHGAGFFGVSWPEDIGGRGLPSVYDVVVDDELAAAGAPPRPSLGYLVHGILEHGSEDIRRRFLPGIVDGRDRWCQGFSEPDAGSDLASLRTRAEREGDEYVLTGHKVWTSYSDDADWCLLLARTDPDAPRHRGLSAFAVPMDQPGIEQRPLPMINGITKEFGEVILDGARVPAANMIGGPGEGWKLAMTVVSHEREPGELGYAARYTKLVNDLATLVRRDPGRCGPEQLRDLGWAVVEAGVLRQHVCRRLSDRLDGISHGPEGSVDKLLMTSTEQTVGHAALAVGGAAHGTTDDTWLRAYLYSRAQSVMGGTSQIQRNLIATRVLGMPAP